VEPYPQAHLYRRVVQAKLFMDAHFAESIDVDDISSEAAFSKFHFIRLFKRVYGFAPHAYLTKVRVQHAQEFLDKGAQVTDACYAVGFTSLGTFSRLFKRHVGIVPSRYRAGRMARATALGEVPLAFIPGCFAERNGWMEKSNSGQVVA
jgi:AraC-like DNA-binding protein